MKLSFRIFIAVFALILTNNVQAQNKFGHINSAELIASMPATKQADSTLKRFAESLDAQYKMMGGEYQKKLQEYQQKVDSMPDAIKAIKEKELEDMGRRIQEFEGSAQDNIGKKKEELYSPILKKAETAVKDIAKEKGFSYILDTSSGTVIFAQESDDIMPLVKAKLGIPVTPKAQ